MGKGAWQPRVGFLRRRTTGEVPVIATGALSGLSCRDWDGSCPARTLAGRTGSGKVGAVACSATSRDRRGAAWAVGDMCRLLEAIRRVSTQLPCQWPVKGATARATTRQSPAVGFSWRHGYISRTSELPAGKMLLISQ